MKVTMKRMIGCLGMTACLLSLPVLAGEPIDDPIPEPIPTGDVHVKLTTVADGMTAPNWGIFAPDDPNDRLFVTDQDGILWVINLDTNEKSVFLDVSDRLVELGIGGPGTFDERGLLGLAFHPNYQNNGLLYTYESHPFEGIEPDFSTMPMDVDPNHQSVITEWHVPNPGDPASTPDPNSARELLRIDQPQFNHDAGAMNFGFDGLLYISLGDGGAATIRVSAMRPSRTAMARPLQTSSEPLFVLTRSVSIPPTASMAYPQTIRSSGKKAWMKSMPTACATRSAFPLT